MEHISNILSALNGNIAAVLLLVISIAVVIYLIKTKQLSFRGKGFTVGDVISPMSRIKQLQWDYLQAETDIALRKLPKEYLAEPKKWRTHYVVGKYRDVLQLAIINNNIVSDDEYIESKQILAYSAIIKTTEDEYFRSAEFEKYVNELTKKIILQFCKIKEKYEQ